MENEKQKIKNEIKNRIDYAKLLKMHKLQEIKETRQILMQQYHDMWEVMQFTEEKVTELFKQLGEPDEDLTNALLELKGEKKEVKDST